MKFKVIYIDTPLDPPGGGQLSLANLVRNLDPSAFEPFVLLSKGGTFERYLKKESIHCEVASSISLFRRMKKLAPDVVHCNSATCKYTFMAAVAAKVLGIPFIWHNRVLETAGWKEHLIAALSDRIVVISGAVGAKFSWCAGKVEKVYNAVDPDVFAPSAPDMRLRETLGIEADSEVVGVFSRMEPWKGHELFLRAAADLRKVAPNERRKFLLVGDGAEKGRLVALAAELGLGTDVIFTGFKEDVPKLMNLCDIVVNPSIEPEPFGRTIIEAMACAKPVIATFGGGPEEIVDNGVNGLLLPPQPGALADGMRSLLSGGRLSGAGLGWRARKKVLSAFGIKAQEERMRAIYVRAVNGK